MQHAAGLEAAGGIDCPGCRQSYDAAGKDPPCDALVPDENGRLVHRCKFGLVDLWDESWPVMEAFRVLRIFGLEAGMGLLRATIPPDELAGMKSDLLRLQGQQNKMDNQKD